MGWEVESKIFQLSQQVRGTDEKKQTSLVVQFISQGAKLYEITLNEECLVEFTLKEAAELQIKTQA